MKSKAYKTQGSVQIYVLTASVLVSITLAAIYLVVQASHKQTLSANNQEQAYYTATSSLQTIVNVLTELSEEPELLKKKLELSKLLLVSTEEPKEITFDFGEEFQSRMGDCVIESTYDSDSLTLTLRARAEQQGHRSTVTAVIREEFSWEGLNDNFFNMILAGKDEDGFYVDTGLYCENLLKPNYTCFKVPDFINCTIDEEEDVGLSFDNTLPQFFFLSEGSTLYFSQSIISLNKPLYFILGENADVIFHNSSLDVDEMLSERFYDEIITAAKLNTDGTLSLISVSDFSQALMQVYKDDENIRPYPDNEPEEIEGEGEGDGSGEIDDSGEPVAGGDTEPEDDHDPDYDRKEDLLNNWNYIFSGFRMGGSANVEPQGDDAY